MDDVTGTPKGTDAQLEDSNAGTSTSENHEEANAELNGDGGAEIIEENAGGIVFGEDEKPKYMFNSQEDAEKSFKEKQRYESELKKQLAEKDARLAELENRSTSPSADMEKLKREIQSIKAEQTINTAFSTYREEHPEFVGKLQDEAKEVIDTYIRAGKSIKLNDAVAIAKARLGLVGDNDPAQTHKVIQSAVLGSSRPGPVPSNRSEQTDPKTKAMMDRFNDPRYMTPGLRKLLKQK